LPWLHADAEDGDDPPGGRCGTVEGADSLVFNPHKWLGPAFDCSLYYVRDPEHLMRVLSTNPSYLQSAVDSRVKNLRDWGCCPDADGR
jgi:glutamate/tyrosine decarboxylase-like PLP-dependent enzyme